MAQDPGKPKPDVDKETAKGKGEGGFNPHPEEGKPAAEFKRGARAKDDARNSTPAARGRSS